MPPDNHSKRSIRLLLVEDDEVDAEAVRRAVKKRQLPYEVAIATDGGEALGLLRNADENWDPEEYFILLDLNMPGMNGHQFLGALREDDQLRRSLVFVLTTSQHERDIKLAYDRNVCGYFLKSDLDGVLDAISQYVATTRFPVS